MNGKAKRAAAAGVAGLLLFVPAGAEKTAWEEIPNANIPAAVIQREVAEAVGMQVELFCRSRVPYSWTRTPAEFYMK